MTTVGMIYDRINKFAPFDTAMDFDNSGLLVGSTEREVSRVAVVLDATTETVSAAAKIGCELIVTHHPVIFSPLSSVCENTPVYDCVKNGISVISAHTNADAADGGVSDMMVKRIEMTDVEKLSDGSATPPMGRIGRIKATDPTSFAAFLKGAFGCGTVRFVNAAKIIKTVAVCGGAGGDFIMPAVNAGANALVTGECKHHERLLAKQHGLSLYECGHFNTEKDVRDVFAELIKELGVDVFVLEEHDPALYI